MGVVNLSAEEARSIILARHGLTQGARYADPASAMRALIAVQTQYPASLAPALAARAEKATARSIDRALTKEKIFLKGWSLRQTLHTALAEDHMLVLGAMSARLAAGHEKWMGSRGIGREKLDELHAQIMEALTERPLGRKELHERVPFYKGVFMVGWGLDAMGLSVEGKLILSRQAAAKTEFARLDQWAPHVERCPLSEEEALKELIRRYFASYGPATLSDFRYWTGHGASRTSAAFNSVREELTEVTVEGKKGEHYIYGAYEKSARPAVRLLPKFDPLMMGRRDKSLFLPDNLRERVFRKAGQVEAVVLAEGQVRATWRTVRRGKTLEFVIEPFGRMKKSWLAALPREALRAAKSLGFGEVTVTTT